MLLSLQGAPVILAFLSITWPIRQYGKQLYRTYAGGPRLLSF